MLIKGIGREDLKIYRGDYEQDLTILICRIRITLHWNVVRIKSVHETYKLHYYYYHHHPRKNRVTLLLLSPGARNKHL